MSISALRHKSPANRYAAAAGIFALAFGARYAVLPATAGYPFITFYPGVAVAAVLCGLAPAFFYIALAAGAGAIFFTAPGWGLDRTDFVPLALFVVSAAGILLIYDFYQRQLLAQARNVNELEERFDITFERAPVGVAHVDPSGRWIRVNQRLCEIVGYDKWELERLNFQDITHPEDKEDSADTMARLVSGAETESVIVKRYIRKGGGIVWVRVSVTMLRYPDGTPRHTVAVIEDITARLHAEQQLRLAAKVFQRAGEGVMITDPQSRILTVNEAFTRITGYTVEDVVGKTPELLKSGRQPPEFYRRLWRQIETEGWWQGEIWNKRKDGEIYPEWLTINVVHDADGEMSNYVAIFSDISAIKKSQQRLDYIASHDHLTALANRGVFQDRLAQAIARARRDDHVLAVLFIDLDNFKTINDTLGHEVGDLLLRETAQRLSSTLRDADSIARLGGDEFAVLLCDIDSLEASAVCHRIGEALSEGFTVGGKELFITASIGISLFPSDGSDDGALLQSADAALYRAKEKGKNQFQYFAETILIAAQRRLALESALRRALSHQSLRLFYQPKIGIVSRTLVGAEALLRWTDPELGPVSPTEFIPLAEKAGLIQAIGQFVATQAISDLRAWHAAGLAPPPIAINVSPIQLRDDHFTEWLQEQLAEAGLPIGSITVEVTESALMDQGEGGLQLLHRLNGHGIKVSIDDFGTGYSSLSYLKRMPISELKIDRSFVDGIAEQADDRAIAAAILGMAHTLGLSVVAEGVETEQQLFVLNGLGCDIAQGFYFHKPMEESRFRELL